MHVVCVVFFPPPPCSFPLVVFFLDNLAIGPVGLDRLLLELLLVILVSAAREGNDRTSWHGNDTVIHICICVYICIYIHTHTSLSLSLYIYIYIYIYVHTLTCNYIYIIIYTYIYIYIYI